MPGGGGTATSVPALPRRAAGVLLSCPTALLGLAYFVVVGAPLGPLLLWPRTRRRAFAVLTAGAGRLTALERRRRSVFFGDRFPDRPVPGPRALRHLALRTYAGLLTGVVLGLLAFGAVLAGLLVAGLVRGTLQGTELVSQVLLGGVLLFLDVQGLFSLQALDARLARECFGPSEHELMQRRIDELATSRAAVLHAVDAERRRIERDLHDGVQQRLVAVAMLLGRARRGGRTPEQARGLLEQAHREAQEVVTELREVAWRVYPAALDNLGLQEALAGVSERCGIPVRTDYALLEPLPVSVETAAYFVVSESVTNAAKHSAATEIRVSVRKHGPVLVVRVEDDGVGGAEPEGGGLTGLQSRVGALDGRLHVHSPAGGPTTITAELPCA
ncbi:MULTISPECIES: sensor histidine kinase [Streptomyces]|uniref:sensor histidine kinase n=1 Tax=Streptomyces TaxID=1883 RepID=UPI001CCB7B65|nr:MULTISPECIES: sensor histidine kinase [Streptomyces]MBZ6140598.1 sensor histidine kinase [Streptomyces olivaceus]MBZ6168360.1 sensor histidine kinase [Streptomyces olivaceus]MCM8555050.1 sensor histidine kinase [Streptomyces sp. STCH 565 A]WFB88706.1 sensor histidine kinase [Streptomyces olivaceus]WGK51065.1 sensor histidine kinase [Streptomyces sp. B146]